MGNGEFVRKCVREWVQKVEECHPRDGERIKQYMYESGATSSGGLDQAKREDLDRERRRLLVWPPSWEGASRQSYRYHTEGEEGRV